MPARQGTIRNDGYVVRTLEAALWAFGRSTTFEEGCLLVANLGDDSDTVAAVFGQVCTSNAAAVVERSEKRRWNSGLGLATAVGCCVE